MPEIVNKLLNYSNLKEVYPILINIGFIVVIAVIANFIIRYFLNRHLNHVENSENKTRITPERLNRMDNISGFFDYTFNQLKVPSGITLGFACHINGINFPVHSKYYSLPAPIQTPLGCCQRKSAWTCQNQ